MELFAPGPGAGGLFVTCSSNIHAQKSERDRLDLQHMLFTISCDGALNFAPIENPKRVLDIATGTGIWAMEFGKTFSPTTSILHPSSYSLYPSREAPLRPRYRY